MIAQELAIVQTLGNGFTSYVGKDMLKEVAWELHGRRWWRVKVPDGHPYGHPFGFYDCYYKKPVGFGKWFYFTCG